VIRSDRRSWAPDPAKGSRSQLGISNWASSRTLRRRRGARHGAVRIPALVAPNAMGDAVSLDGISRFVFTHHVGLQYFLWRLPHQLEQPRGPGRQACSSAVKRAGATLDAIGGPCALNPLLLTQPPTRVRLGEDRGRPTSVMIHLARLFAVKPCRRGLPSSTPRA